MADEEIPQFDISRVNRRVGILNDAANEAVTEILKTGRLRVTVDRAFSEPEDLCRLLARICILKLYAESAAAQLGSPMSLSDWCSWFDQFQQHAHVAPKLVS